MKCKFIARLAVPLLLICTFANSQTFTLSAETGYSSHHAAVAGFTAGVNFKWFSIRTGMDAHMTQRVNGGMVFKTMIGHTFNLGDHFYGTASVGHSYLYQSADNKSLNSNRFLINPEAGYKFDFKQQPMSLYISYTGAGELKMMLLGIRGYF